MALSPGTCLGSYDIAAQIGVGGMGEVYRATDTNLKRQVAIKVLPASVAGDTERLARFQREAEVLAALNHPNIAAIYGIERTPDFTGLVMELVEGEDLSQRIARGAIPVDEVVPIAKQIAEALEAAHEQGIIHRDLKPANIKVRADGTVKVLDFGLAKAMDQGPGIGVQGSGSASMSPTITTPAMTQAGMILGTAAYMSPEQAKGRTVDKRTDIWAFGCVLYEMLTARRAFGGDDVQDAFVAIMRDEPDWSRLPATLSPTLGTYLRRCLHKDAKHRVHDIADVRLALEGAFETAGPQAASPVVRDPRRHVAALVVGAFVIAAVTGATVWLASGRVTSVGPELRLDITTPAVDGMGLVSIAISPDGRRVVYGATADGITRLWLRPLDATAAQPLPGTDGGFLPFWSPDGRSVGFFADGQLKRIDIAGGSVQALIEARSPRGGTWNRDGVIVFAPSAVDALYRISAAGGPATMLTQLEKPAQSDHRAPQFLPDGRHFLYYARGTAEGRGVYVGALDGTRSQRLLDADAGAVYAASGYLLFVRQSTLFAVRFDADQLTLVGDPFPVANQVVVDGRISLAALSASAAGPIIYRAGAIGQTQLAWVDRSGTKVEPVGDADSPVISPALSPDGRQLVVARNVDSNWDLWLLDTARGVRTRLTSDPSVDAYGVWSPDGRRLVFFSGRNGSGLYAKAVAGTDPEDALPNTVGMVSTDWSSDGRFLLAHKSGPTADVDLWVVPLSGDRTPRAVAQSRFNERDGQFSPDGRWVAYSSDESGRSEIYVQPFPGPGEKVQVSSAGGGQVRWRGDGKELFYVALDARLMAVPIQLPPTGQTIVAGRPVPLFATHIGGALQGTITAQYGVARDGQRFLMATVSDDTPPISVILNWAPTP